MFLGATPAAPSFTALLTHAHHIAVSTAADRTVHASNVQAQRAAAGVDAGRTRVRTLLDLHPVSTFVSQGSPLSLALHYAGFAAMLDDDAAVTDIKMAGFRDVCESTHFPAVAASWGAPWPAHTGHTLVGPMTKLALRLRKTLVVSVQAESRRVALVLVRRADLQWFWAAAQHEQSELWAATSDIVASSAALWSQPGQLSRSGAWARDAGGDTALTMMASKFPMRVQHIELGEMPPQNALSELIQRFDELTTAASSAPDTVVSNDPKFAPGWAPWAITVALVLVLVMGLAAAASARAEGLMRWTGMDRALERLGAWRRVTAPTAAQRLEQMLRQS